MNVLVDAYNDPARRHCADRFIDKHSPGFSISTLRGSDRKFSLHKQADVSGLRRCIFIGLEEGCYTSSGASIAFVVRLENAALILQASKKVSSAGGQFTYDRGKWGPIELTEDFFCQWINSLAYANNGKDSVETLMFSSLTI